MNIITVMLVYLFYLISGILAFLFPIDINSILFISEFMLIMSFILLIGEIN